MISGVVQWSAEDRKRLEAMTLRVNAVLALLQQEQLDAGEAIAGHAMQLAQEKVVEALLWYNQAVAYGHLQR